MAALRVIFAGTPEFARTALEKLHSAGFEIPLVLSQPDRPAGRGMKLQASPVKQWALQQGFSMVQPRSLRLDGKFPEEAAAAQAAVAEACADAMVVAAYGLILPQWVLDAPRLGCLNIHASLLPRWRGAAPIHRAVEAGDRETGVTIMQMDAGLDTGAMLLQQRIGIVPTDTTGTLHDRLAALGGKLIVEALRQAAAGSLRATPQPADGVTYAQKIDKAEAAVDWRLPASVVARKVRAFDPAPGASALLQGETLKLWRADIAESPAGSRAAPGTVLAIDAGGIAVACGEGVVRITEVQRAGGKRLPVPVFLRGFNLAAPAIFG